MEPIGLDCSLKIEHNSSGSKMNSQSIAAGNMSERFGAILFEADHSHHIPGASEERRSQKAGCCRHCGRRLTLRQRISGARFCSPGHDELARRTHVEHVSRLLEATDVTKDLQRSEIVQSLPVVLVASEAPKIRREIELCRPQALVLPKCIERNEWDRLAQSFGAQCLLEPAKGTSGLRNQSLEWLIKDEPRRTFAPALNVVPVVEGSGLAGDSI